MIEFKAECGHTVRAKDDDAGGVVRCSYCGRQAAVPETREDDLDFLFRDVQPAEDGPGARRRKRRRGPGIFKRRAPRSPGRFDPFAIILRMCYAAVLISIVIFLGRKYVVPLFKEGGISGRIAPRAKQRPEGEPREVATRRERQRRAGLIAMAPVGLYVASTPPRATVYVVEQAQAPSKGRIKNAPGCKRALANGECLGLPDGTYAVEVVLPTHHPSLNDPNLPHYREYREFRRAIERASTEERAKLLEEYFVPDDAWPVFVERTEEQYFIVRQFRNVQIRDGRSNGVRALFLPKIRPGGRKTFSIAPLVTHYIPRIKAYAFNEDHVRNELAYYDVPESDQMFLVEGLARIGVMPYVTRDGRSRLFKIDIHDGVCTAKTVRETSE